MEFWGGLAFTYLPLKRFYKYILKRLVGSFLLHEIDLDKLEVQLFNGIVQLKALELDVSQFNIAAAKAGFCVHFVSGFVGTIKMDIPWRHLLGEHCKIYIDGVHLVLAKGSPPDPVAPSPFLEGGASPLGELQAPVAREPGPSRYSDEGIQTLSRLVKHVLSKTEACFHDISVSLLTPSSLPSPSSTSLSTGGMPKAESLLRARVSSVVVFSEQAPAGLEVVPHEARSVRVLGINLSLVRPGACLSLGHSRGETAMGVSAPASSSRSPASAISCDDQQEESELILLSSDGPAGSTSSPGELHFRRRPAESGEGEHFRGLGTHIDLELFLPSLRVAVTPVAYSAVAFCLSLIEGQLEEPPRGGEDSPVSADGAATPSRRAPSMMQSLVESSITGPVGHAAFWHELYNLFEADSQLEDTAGCGSDVTEGWDPSAQEDDDDFGGLAKGPVDSSSLGPVVGYTFRLNISRVGVVLVLGDTAMQGLGPQDVKLLPGPATGIPADQVQLCAESWEVTVSQQLPPPPGDNTTTAASAAAAEAVACSSAAAVIMVRTAVVHLHHHRAADGQQRTPDLATTQPQHAASTSASAALDAVLLAAMVASEESHSNISAMPAASPYSTSCRDVEVNPTLFCSAMSSSPATTNAIVVLPAPVLEEQELERQSSHTTESFGGSDTDSDYLLSAASSLHSFDSVSNPASPLPQRAEASFSSALGSSPSVLVGNDFGVAPPPFLPMTVPAVGMEEHVEPRAAWGPGEAQSDEESDSELSGAKKNNEAESEDLEAIFFSRSRPIRDVLRCETHRVSSEEPADDNLFTGSSAASSGSDGSKICYPGWHRTSRDFRSKRLLRLVRVARPLGEVAGREEVAEGEPLLVPRLTLPPPGHPLWGCLHLTGSQQSASSIKSGHQIRVEFGEYLEHDIASLNASCAEMSPSHTFLRVECQPVVISLCSDSIHILSSGASRLQGSVATRRRPPPHQPSSSCGDRSGCFGFAAVVPLVRLELELGQAVQGPCSLVADLVAPRLFARPSDCAAEPSAGMVNFFEECLHVEISDAAAYLVASDARAPASTDSGPSQALCKKFFSIDDNREEEGSAKVLLSIFQQKLAEVEPEKLEPEDEVHELPRPVVVDVLPPLLSEWTKISQVEGPQSKSSLILQDLRGASQRLMRPGHTTREPAEAVPSSLLARDHDVEPGPGGVSGDIQGLAIAVAGQVDSGLATEIPSSLAGSDVRVPQADNGGGCDGPNGGGMVDGQFEIKINVPKTVQLHFDSEGLQLLQEACGVFATNYALLALEVSAGLPPSPLLAQDAPVNEEVPGAPLFGGTLSIECLQFEVLDVDVPAKEQLQFYLSSVQCRFVKESCLSFKVCTLGQDLRFVSFKPCQNVPEQLIRPWFSPIFYPLQRKRGVGTADAPASPAGSNSTIPASCFCSAGYPWEALPVGHCTSVVSPVFSRIDQGQWRDTHSVLLEMTQQRLGAFDHTHVSVKMNKLVFNAHPHVNQVYGRLLLFFKPANCGANATSTARWPTRPVYAPLNSFNDFQVSAIDCFVDMPSEAHSQQWPMTSPRGLDVPTMPPTTRGGDGDKWRAIVHIGGLDLSFGTSQGFAGQEVSVTASECNVFLVDHPSRLSLLDLISSTPEPLPFLSSLGFAHILELSGTSASWGSQSSAANTGEHEENSTRRVPSRLLSKSHQSFELVVGNLAGNVCADTVKCLLYAGMELAENFSSYTLPSQPRPSGTELRPTQVQAAPGPSEASNLLSPTSAGLLSPTGVNILNTIDMFAFESPTAPAVDGAAFDGAEIATLTPHLQIAPQTMSHVLEGCLIEDYIRAQQELQGKYSPIQGYDAPPAFLEEDPPSIDLEETELMYFDSDSLEPQSIARDISQQSSSSVDVCLLDPEAYSGERLRELHFQDRTARREVEQMYMQDSVAAEALATVAPEQRKVLHQAGSAAVWLIDPADLQIVQDHFTPQRSHGSQESSKLKPPLRAPPIEFTATFRCNLMQLSLYAGADFADDAQSKMHTRTAAPEAKIAHLTLQLQESVVKLMSFDASAAVASEPHSSTGIFNRRLVVCVRDFCILDRVQSSVFSHLLAYYEDERNRPRPNQADMLHLQVDEVLCRPESYAVLSGKVLGESSPEFRVDVKLLPLRLTLDQDVVEFSIGFVQLCTLPTYVEEVEEESGSSLELHDADELPATAGELISVVRAKAVDGIGNMPDIDDAFFDATAEDNEMHVGVGTRPSAGDDGLEIAHGDEIVGSLFVGTQSRPIVFQHIRISALLASVDYKAKRLDAVALRNGELWELINLLPLLEGLEVAFRTVTISGVFCPHDVLAQLVNAWSADLNRTQVLRSLTGVTPIRSFTNIGGGFADMVLEPLKQYRAGKGTERVSSVLLQGLVSFMKHVTVESIGLTEQIFMGTHSALEYVADTYLPEPQEPLGTSRASAARRPESLGNADANQLAISDNWTAVERGTGDFLQPGSASEGLQRASVDLTRGLLQAGQVAGRPLLELKRGASKEKVMQSIVSGIPICVLRPAIGATAAAATALRGLRNSVDPVRRREGERKYKEPE